MPDDYTPLMPINSNPYQAGESTTSRSGNLWSLIPANCLVCQLPCQRDVCICQYCEDSLPWLHFCCERCGLPFPESVLKAGRCGKCLGKRFPVDSCRSLFAYDTPVRQMINAYKHGARLDIGYSFAKLLANDFTAPESELLLPVPISYSRFCGRGFNQSWELTKNLSLSLDIPCSNAVFKKHRHTPAQSSQNSAQARQRNLHGAFSIRNEKHLENVNSVTIIDDVVTTMATVTNLAQLLKRRGIGRVDVLCVARTCL